MKDKETRNSEKLCTIFPRPERTETHTERRREIGNITLTAWRRNIKMRERGREGKQHTVSKSKKTPRYCPLTTKGKRTDTHCKERKMKEV